MNECLKPKELQDPDGYYYPIHEKYSCYPYCLAREAKNEKELREAAEYQFKRYQVESIMSHFTAEYVLKNREVWDVIDDILEGAFIANALRENGLFDIALSINDDCEYALPNCLKSYDDKIIDILSIYAGRKYKWEIRVNNEINYSDESKASIINKIYDNFKNNYYKG